MADSKIVDLTEKTTPHYDDEVVVNDVENSNVDKKYAIGTLGNMLSPVLPPIMGNITDHYYTLTQEIGIAWSTNAGAPAGFLHYIPFSVGQPLSFNRIGVDVVVAGAAGAELRLGIYTVNSDGTPGTLVVDAGKVDCTSTGLKEATISVTLCGNYYFCYISDDSTIDFRGLDNSDSSSGVHLTFGSVDGTSSPRAHWRISGGDIESGLASTATQPDSGSAADSVRFHLRNV